MATLGDGTITVTVTLSVAEPPGPIAVMVYVVVLEGLTSHDPDGSNVPTSGSITQLSAFVEVHVRMEYSSNSGFP